MNNPQTNNRPDEQPESDSQRLTRKHMEDPNHVISDEEMASLKVGQTSVPDESTNQAVAEAEERISDSKSNSEDDTLPGAQKITPWDTVNP